MNTNHSQGVFLIGFGGPDSAAEVRPFVERVLEGRRISPERFEKVCQNYSDLGGKSPYADLARRQQQALRKFLEGQNINLPVFLGFRHSKPTVEDALQEMSRNGIRTAIGVVLAPHRSSASFDRYVAAVDQARRQMGLEPLEINFISAWHTHPLFIEAIVSRISDALTLQGWSSKDSLKTEIVFTAHSLPCDMAGNSAYETEVRQTAEYVMKRVGKFLWDIAYQSRSGDPREPWLGPDINEWIRARNGKGLQNILVVPIGFLLDHVEVLVDLDKTARQSADKEGISYARAQTVMDHPKFIEMLAELVREKAVVEQGNG